MKSWWHNLTMIGIAVTFGGICQTAISAEISLEPAGFVKITVLAGQSRAIAFPFRSVTAFRGIVTNYQNGALVSTASWAANAYGPFDSNPYFCLLTTGSSAGQFFKIKTNGSNVLNLDVGIGNSVQILAGDKYQILGGVTLGGLLGAQGEGLLTSADPKLADNILLLRDGVWKVFYNDGSKWLLENGGTLSQNTVCISPVEGLILVRRASTPLDLVLGGRVPDSSVKSTLSGNGETFLANTFPSNRSLVDLGLEKDPSWRKAMHAEQADSVYILSNTGWLQYFNNGTNWMRVAGGATAQNPLIPVGAAIDISRNGGVDVSFSQNPPQAYQ